MFLHDGLNQETWYVHLVCVNLDQMLIELLSKLCCTFTSFMVQCFTSHSYTSIWRHFPQSRLHALKTAQIPVLIPVLFPVVIPVVIPKLVQITICQMRSTNYSQSCLYWQQ